MEDRVLAPVFALLAAAVLAIFSPSEASAADPSGIWAKDDGSAKVEIKKCGRGLCGEVVWLRNPNNSRGQPLHDVRNENASLRGRPIIGLPLFSNMRPTGPNSWAGNVYNPVEGRIYTDVKLTLVSSRQIVLRGCRTWLMCGEKTWTRSTLPPDARTPQLIEVKAPAEPGTSEKAAPRSVPQLEAPMIEASAERESLSTPGFTLVSTPARQKPLAGDDVLSMAMTGVAPTPATVVPKQTAVAPKQTTAAPVPTETAAAEVSTETAAAEVPTETAAAEEQWPWMQRRSARPSSNETAAEAQAVPAAPVFAKPKPRPFVMASQGHWPWQRRRLRAAAQAPAPVPAAPIVVKAKPKPVAREAQEQWPWMQRRPVVMVATQAPGY